jgi:hypothetical protein
MDTLFEAYNISSSNNVSSQPSLINSRQTMVETDQIILDKNENPEVKSEFKNAKKKSFLGMEIL